MEAPIKYNETASGILWTAFVIYLISFFFPAYVIIDFIFLEGITYGEMLNGIGIIIYLIAVVLVGLGAYFTTKGMSVKIYAWGSLIPMGIIIAVLFSQMNDNSYYITSTGIGLWSNIFGMGLALIGGLVSNKIIPNKPKKSKKQHPIYPQGGYQQPQQQGYQQPINQVPVQQPPTQTQDYQPIESKIPNEQKIETKNFCGSCGRKSDPDSLFCENCGSKF
jgi:hypothetical protein